MRGRSAELCGRSGGGGAHDSTGRARGVVVQLDHVHHPRDFAGRVDIVGPVPHAGGHHGGAVLDVRADGRNEAARARREPLQRGHSQVREDGLCRGKYTISGMLAGIGTARAHAPTGTRSGKRALKSAARRARRSRDRPATAHLSVEGALRSSCSEVSLPV